MAWTEDFLPWKPLPPGSPYINEVKQAVFALYQHPEKAMRSQAETWLLQQQRLPITWQAGWSLLDFKNSVEEQYFGAHFIYHKISQCWSTINIDHFQHILQMLFQKVVEYRKGPSFVRTRLTVAVASFAVHAMQGPWPGAVTHTISYLSQYGNVDVALEVLVLIPEELASASNYFTSVNKNTIRMRAKESIGNVLEFTGECYKNPQYRETCCEVINSWVTFELPVETTLPLIDRMFDDIRNKSATEMHVECIVNFLRQPSLLSYPNSIWRLLSKVAQLKPILGESLQVEDLDLCQGICQLVLAILEPNSKLILDTKDSDKLSLVSCLLSMLLDCTGISGHYPVDESFSDTTLQFWYTFGDEIVSEEPEKSALLLTQYSTVFQKLVEVLIRKVMYPSDEYWDSWSDENKVEFENYRKEVGDTVLNIQAFIPQCINVLHAEYLVCQGLKTSWQRVEAVLFMFRSIAEMIYEKEDGDNDNQNVISEIISSVIESLPVLPKHPKISRTALLLCGAYSEWLRVHPDKMIPAVKILMSHVNDPSLAPASVQAFRDVCVECADLLAGELAVFIEPFQMVYNNPDIKNREKIRLCWSLCTLCSQVDPEHLVGHLQSLLSGSCIALKKLASNTTVTKENKEKIKLEIGMFNAAFHAISIPPAGVMPLVSLLSEIWEPLKAVLVIWSGDEAVIEELIKCYWHAINCLGPLFERYLEALVDMLCQCYNANQYPCLLESGAQGLLNIYAQEKPDLIATMLQRLSNTTFQLFATRMSDRPDIIQSFFSLHLSALRTHPQIVYRQESNCKAVLRAAVTAITMQEYHTVKEVCRWLTEFIGHYTVSEEVQTSIKSEFNFLVSELLRGIGTASPSSTVDFLGEIFLPLTRIIPNELRQAMIVILESENFPTKFVSSDEKSRFIVTLFQVHGHKRRLKREVKEFSLLCRGYSANANTTRTPR